MTLLALGYVLGMLSCAVFVHVLLRSTKPLSIKPSDVDRIESQMKQCVEGDKLRDAAKMCLTQYCGVA